MTRHKLRASLIILSTVLGCGERLEDPVYRTHIITVDSAESDMHDTWFEINSRTYALESIYRDYDKDGIIDERIYLGKGHVIGRAIDVDKDGILEISQEFSGGGEGPYYAKTLDEAAMAHGCKLGSEKMR